MVNQIDKKPSTTLTSNTQVQEHPESVLLDYANDSIYSSGLFSSGSPKIDYIPGSFWYNVPIQRLTDPSYISYIKNEGQNLINPNNFFGAVDFLAKKVGNKLLSLANLDMNNIYNPDWNKNSTIQLLNAWEKLDLQSLEPYLGGFKAGGAFYKTNPIQYMLNKNAIQASYNTLRNNFWKTGQLPSTLVIAGT